ncbi:ArdC-like ssDNA-binding domain-containing protein, partial [uncultured Flavonifractor sp.]|uniref:ArdC-like ssDNA-binding domain-containing protein n=1 Tax=uncultured Flavonifractor sp. TaxID=1193534 RepID=UPI002620C3FC
MSEERTAYEKLTPQRKLLYDAVMRHLENGTGIWEQGWEGGGGAPVSAITGKHYSGVNRLSLMLAALERGYSDNRWLTYKQMEDKGWSFKRNEEGKSLGKNAGVTIEYFELRDKETKQPFDRHVLDGMTADERNEYMEENVFPLRKYYRVFNGDLIEGIPALEKKKTDESGRNQRAQRLIDFWSDTECPIVHGGSMAYYNPVNDEIHLPRRESF